MKYFENITNRKLIAFIVGNVMGIFLEVMTLITSPYQFVDTIPAFLTYHAGILTAFVAANAASKITKGK